MNRTWPLGTAGLLLLLSWWPQAWAGESPEAALRAQFAKDYSAPKAEDRKAAVEKLATGAERATLDMLLKVAGGDRDKLVRVAAAQTIAQWRDADGTISGALLQIFLGERDRFAKAEMAASLKNARFKTPVLEQLVRYFQQQDYPQLLTGPGAAKANEELSKRRDAFTSVLETINALSGQGFQPSLQARQDVQRWWTKSGLSDAQKADAETAKKIRDEQQEAAKKKASPK